MHTQIEIFKKLTAKIGEETANDLVSFITETAEKMDSNILTQKDKVEIIKEIGEIRKAIDINFKWFMGIFVTILLSLFALIFKAFH